MDDRTHQIENLEGVLRAIADSIEFPATPQLAFAVGARIRTGGPIGVASPWWRRSWAGLGAAAGAVLVLVFAAVLGTSSEARAALEDILEVGGLTIDLDGEERPVTLGALEAQLGPEVGLEEAQRDAFLPVALPSSLGEPTTVHRKPFGAGVVITLVYEDVGGETIILTQFHGDINVFKAAPRSQVEFVEINGAAGYWIRGPHTVTYPFSRVPDGAPTRAVENVLAWEADSVTFRLETALTLPEALAIAESVE